MKPHPGCIYQQRFEKPKKILGMICDQVEVGGPYLAASECADCGTSIPKSNIKGLANRAYVSEYFSHNSHTLCLKCLDEYFPEALLRALYNK